MNSLLVGSSEAIVRMIGPKASAVLVNAFRSGTNIYGAAAMKSAAKLLRGNAIHRCCVVCSPLDWRCWKYLCWSDLRRSTLQKSGQYSVYGRCGGAGWVAGAAAGAAFGSVVPIVGTAVGGVLGGLAGAFGGGSLASKATGAVLDQFIEDDADKMVAIIQEVFTQLADDYLISQEGSRNDCIPASGKTDWFCTKRYVCQRGPTGPSHGI